MTVSAVAVCDSISPNINRLLTIKATSPKFIHQETLRHRTIYIEDALRGDPDFSFSVSSARAIPFKKLLEEVTSDLRAKPVKWGAEQKGMSPGDELPAESIDRAEWTWQMAADSAAHWAERMAELGVHKSIVNRIIEPYFHCHALMSATDAGWMNWFGLRLDNAADPTLKALAEECWRIWNESTPRGLKPGQWHLPFIDEVAEHEIAQKVVDDEWPENTVDDRVLEICQQVSVARCARLSYVSFETGKRSTIEEDLKLYDRLVGGYPIHASPAEHQATPDFQNVLFPDTKHELRSWLYPKQHGNFTGWRQYRKMLPGEAVAPLPKEYA